MKRVFVILTAVLLTASVFAQAPQKMSYQTVIRDAGNKLVASKAVSLQISILQNSSTGTPVYVETHSGTTNANGLLSIEIGAGVPVGTGVFSNINWAMGPYFVQTEIDPSSATGTTYVIKGVSQLLSVPYALYSANSANSANGILMGTTVNPGDMNYWNGLNWVPVPVGSENQLLKLSPASVPTWSFVTPIISTTAVTAVTNVSAISGGYIISDGGSAVQTRGVCWNTSINPTTANPKTSDGTGAGLFSSSVKSLALNTTYYLRAYATNTIGISYGAQQIFTTLATATAPIVNTIALSDITSTTVTSGVNIISTGGSVVLAQGVCWGVSPSPSITGNVVPSTPTGSEGSFVVNITGLAANTTYYLRAYANNAVGTTYGSELSFKTALAQALPTVVTAPITGVTNILATGGGDVTANGGSLVTVKGLCWSTSASPTTANIVTNNGAGTGPFVSEIGSVLFPLLPGTKYYVRAYAINGTGPGYGEQLTFTTDLTGVPAVVTDLLATNVTAVSATCSGGVTSTGGAAVTVKGVCWSIYPNPTTASNHSTDGGAGIGTFTSAVTGLSMGTTYYVRAYASNTAGSGYGEEFNFTTLATLQPPTLAATTAIDNIQATSATSGGNVTSDGGSPVTARGVCWSTAINPTTTSAHSVDGSGTGVFVSTMSSLVPNTKYYVRSYATNNVETTYGTSLSFTTLPDVTLPLVTTVVPYDITAVTAWSGGIVNSDGGSPIISMGVCWDAKETSPTPDNAVLYADTEGSSFALQLGSGFTNHLTANTKYYVRAFAQNSVGIGYGTVYSFTTLPSLPYPTITTSAITNSTPISAIGGGIISGDGTNILVRGICWSTVGSPTTLSSLSQAAMGGAGNFTCQLLSLQPSTTYHVRAYFIAGAATVYGNEVTFTTTAITAPVLAATTAATLITDQLAVSGGNVTSDGGAAVSGRGICWSTLANPSTVDGRTGSGTGTGVFTCNVGSNVSPLVPNTKYYVRAYARNSVGLIYGDQMSFTTLGGMPTLGALADITSITTTGATCGGTVLNDGGSPVVARGVCWGPYYAPTTTNSYTTNGTGTGAFVSAITGLVGGTTYFVRAYARNSTGIAYSTPTVAFDSSPLVPILTSTLVPSGITNSSVTVGGEILRNGGSPILERGVYFSSTPGVIDEGSPFAIAGTGTGSFSAVNTLLQPNTRYYILAYARNSIGTGFAPTVLNFTTLAYNPNLPVVLTGAVSLITSSDATGSGNVTSIGSTPVTSRGLCWSSIVNPVTSVSGTGTAVSGAGIGSFSCPLIDAYDSQLTFGTVYYVRAFAKNTAGTVYGDQVSFKTLPVLPTIAATSAASSITANSAVSGGNVTNDGGAPVTGRGICWSSSPNPTLSNMAGGPDCYAGTGTGTFACTIGNDETGWLQPKSIYYVRAYATNSVGTVYGTQISFTTLANLPGLSTTVVSSITSTGAMSGGVVYNDNGAAVTGRGVCWGLTATPTTGSLQNAAGSGTGSFACAVGNVANPLTPATLYYVRSYAVNSIGAGYGNQISFTTLAVGIPTLSTTAVSSISSTSAVGGGNVTDAGGAPVSVRGVCWSRIEIPVTAGTTLGSGYAVAGSGIGTFACAMVNQSGGFLSPYTKYFVRAFATNTSGTAYGDQVSFMTLASLPVLTTTAASAITPSNAVVGGNILSNGGSSILERGVCLTNSPFLEGDYYIVSGTSVGLFSMTITKLMPATSYYVFAYARNSVGISYGDQLTFTTLPASVPIIAPTTAVTSPTSTGGVSGGDITGDGGSLVSSRGVCWGITSNPVTSPRTGPQAYAGTGTGAFTCAVGNGSLQAETRYYVRAFGVNSMGTAYGTQVHFTTSAATVPALTTTAVTAITTTSAMSGGTVTSAGGATVIERGVCWRIGYTPQTVDDDYSLATSAGVGTYTCAVGNAFQELIPNTEYYVRSFASNAAGTGYGNQIIFTTSPILSGPPALAATTAVDLITTTNARSGGNVTSDGGATVTARGVCWSTRTSPNTTSGGFLSAGTGTGVFTCAVGDARQPLTPGTYYYVRSYAINTAGTAYGAQVGFSTLAAVPLLGATTAASSITETSAMSGGNVTSAGASAVLERGVCWSEKTSPTITSSRNIATLGTGVGTFTCAVGGAFQELTANTSYSVRSYATNSIGTGYGTQISFITPAAILPPIIE